MTNHNTPKKSFSTDSTPTMDNQQPLSLPQIKNSIMFKKFQYKQQIKQKSVSVIDTPEQSVHFQRYNILSEMKNPQLKKLVNYTYSGFGTNIKPKYHYLSSSDQTSNMLLEKFGQGFLSNRVQNDCVKHFVTNNNYLITEWREEPRNQKDKSPILKEQITQMPKSYYRQGLIYETKQKSTPIRLKKTSQSERNKKFRQNVAINKMNNMVNNAIENIRNEKIEQQKKEEIADLKSKRVRKTFEIYKQYF